MRPDSQALRPFPQYTTINTLDGGGDRIGHSTYHSLMIKFDKRMASGLTVQASYKVSKLLTDSDSTTSAAGDMYNLRLLKSIASFDQTTPGQTRVGIRTSFRTRKGFPAQRRRGCRGGWWLARVRHTNLCQRIAVEHRLHRYFPIGDFSNRPTISTYDSWRGPICGGKVRSV